MAGTEMDTVQDGPSEGQNIPQNSPQSEPLRLPAVGRDPETSYNRGMAAFGRQNWTNAVEHFSSIVDAHPEWSKPDSDPEKTKSAEKARYYLGLSFIRLGKWEDAAAQLNAYLGKKTNTHNLGVAYNEYADAIYNLALGADEKGKPEKFLQALTSYEKSLEQPGISDELADECRLMMGVCCTELADISRKDGNEQQQSQFIEQAKGYFNHLIENDSKFAEQAERGKAYVSLQGGDYLEAVSLLPAGSRNRAVAELRAADKLFQAKEYDKAINLIESAFKNENLDAGSMLSLDSYIRKAAAHINLAKAGSEQTGAHYENALAAASKLLESFSEGSGTSPEEKQRIFVQRAAAMSISAEAHARLAVSAEDAAKQSEHLTAMQADLKVLSELAGRSRSSELVSLLEKTQGYLADTGYAAEQAGAGELAAELYTAAGPAGGTDLAWLQYAKNKDYAKAVESFGVLIRTDKAGPDEQSAYLDALALRVGELQKAGDAEGAKEQLELLAEQTSALTMAAPSQNVHTALAHFYFESDNFEKADVHLTALAKIPARREFAVHGLMVSGLRQGDWDQVLENAATIIGDEAMSRSYKQEAAAASARGLTAKGQIKEAWKTADELQTELTAALEEAPEDEKAALEAQIADVRSIKAEIYITHGSQLAETGKIDEARSAFESAAGIFPNSEIALRADILRGNTFVEDNPTEAAEIYDEVVNDAEAYISQLEGDSVRSANFTELRDKAAQKRDSLKGERK